MAKEKQSSKDPITKKNFDDADAVLKLTIDGSYPNAEVREIQPASKDSFQTPCSVNGLFAGMTGGSVGFLFGFGGYWLKYRLKGTLSAAMKEGWGSAKAFAVMGGIYAAVNCFMLRIRQKQDGTTPSFFSLKGRAPFFFYLLKICYTVCGTLQSNINGTLHPLLQHGTAPSPVVQQDSPSAGQTVLSLRCRAALS